MAETQGLREPNLPKTTFDESLKSYHVKSSTDLDLWLTEEAWKEKKAFGWRELRKAIEGEMSASRENPFGENSLDPLIKSGKRKSRSMSINSVSENLQKLFPDFPLAIKSLGNEGIWQEDLAEQFQVMRSLQLIEEKLPEDVRRVIRFAKVYGAISSRAGQWLLMERVVNAQEVKETQVSDSKDSNLKHSGFSIDEYPELARLIVKYCPVKEINREGNNIRLRSLRKVFERFGLPLGSLNGRDILCQVRENGKKSFVIIDLKKEDLKQSASASSDLPLDRL